MMEKRVSGHHGVTWNVQRKKWHAQAWFEGKQHYVGVFDNLDEAIEAHKAALGRLYGAKWTPALDARLVEMIDSGVCAHDAGVALGISANSVRQRAFRLGRRFARQRFAVRLNAGVDANHRAADERSAEILRNVGMRI